MDAVQALAILSLGAFVAILVTAIAYVFAVRPRLLQAAPGSADGALERSLFQDDLLEQRVVIERLADAIDQHTEEVRAATVGALPPEQRGELLIALAAHTEAAESLKILLDDHATQINWVDGRLSLQDGKLDQIASRLDHAFASGAEGDEEPAAEGLARVAAGGVAPQLQAQSEKLDQVIGDLRGLAPANAVERLEIRVEQVSKRLDDMVPATAHESMAGMLREQAARLVEIGERLDEWASRELGDDERLAESVRLLTEIDQRLAAQAEIAAQLDTKVSESSSLLHDVVSGRQEQASLLEQTTSLLGQLSPVAQRVANVSIPPERDRLTDITGIGPVYAAKLYEAGVDTFEELASLTPEEIQSIVGLPRWRFRSADMTNWIEQARMLAVRREKLEN